MRSERAKVVWAQLLAYVTGTLDHKLLLRNEYLEVENRILKPRFKVRLLLSQEESGTIRARKIEYCFLFRRRQEGTWEQCGVENDWAAC